jgi:lysine/arginine/ornithine transport system substrate-binding protein
MACARSVTRFFGYADNPGGSAQARVAIIPATHTGSKDKGRKNMKAKSAILGCVALALALASSASAMAKDWSTVRFGVDASYPPFESKSADGKLVGFDIDLGNEICKRIDAKCVWIENSFDGMIPALKARKFDGVLSTMSMTPARAAQIAFSTRVFRIPTRLVAAKGSTLEPTPEALKGKRIGVEQGSIQETYARTYWEPAGAVIVPYQDQDLVYADLISGRIDASLQNAAQADIGFLRTPKGRDFAFAGNPIYDAKTLGSGTAIGLRKEDTDLKAKIDKAIDDIRADGTYDKLAKRYFSFDIYGQ